MDRTLAGLPASPGIVVGPVYLLRWEVPEVGHRIIGDDVIHEEIERLRLAFGRAKERLRHIRARAEAQAGPEEARIFDAQLMILEDPSLLEEVESVIHRNYGAEKAFDLVMLEHRQHFARQTHALIREKVSDLTDVHIRVLTALLDLPDHDPIDVPKGANAVLLTHDLTPSLTVQLDREAIVGIATDGGTSTSHVAILARSLGLPAVLGLRDATTRLTGDERVVLDGFAGVLVVNPTDAEVDAYRARARREAERQAELRHFAAAEPITKDGVRINVLANVDLPEEAESAAQSGAEGVGLMRTEFLVVGRANMPDEDEQYRSYARVVEAFGGQPVIIRTFDVGGDKLPAGTYPVEQNPFLGWRAIRMCLDESELFKTQLRALLRAARHGDVRIMLPLVVTVDEVHQARTLIQEAAEELDARGVAYNDSVPVGVMVETPAAAVAVDTFAKDVAFFSIGTNDLVQYTLAVDRGNANMAARFTPLHPAVLRLIQRIAEVGQRHRLEVGVCGEMASDPLMAFALIGLGLRQLSVAPRSVALVKRLIRGVDVETAAAAAKEAMSASTAAAAERGLRRRLMAALADDPILGENGLPHPA
ncbi:MAG TPA: phosphoenolpyruvate--protein phosphotransferase [Gemmatimonadaceae bacterium]|nr:phosphoenolpyruvate--protein phosphotransferase [Gemmatimonadaceae bacterium]